MKQIRIKAACCLGRWYYAVGDIANVPDGQAEFAVARGMADLYVGNTVPADGREHSEEAHMAEAQQKREEAAAAATKQQTKAERDKMVRTSERRK
jgi:hypothetical protein